MNIIFEKKILKSQIDNINDEEYIIMLKSIIDFINRKKYSIPMSIDEYNNKLAESEEDYNIGKTLNQDELLNEVNTWKQNKEKEYGHFPQKII